MIDRSEILEVATDPWLAPEVVEKDYVLGWLLAGIYRNEELAGADARRVEVRFEGDPDAPTRVVVTDDGIGMDLDIVLNAWLEPGTVLKKKNDHSPGGRLYQGAKGIGRFAAARLGATLFLETRREGADEVVRVLLNWGSFTDESYLDDIEVDYEVVADPGTPVGTRLTIEGLQAKRDRLIDELENQLHRQLTEQTILVCEWRL